MTTTSELALSLSQLLNKWHLREDEMVSWLTGTETGGPNQDGTYPITLKTGQKVSLPCPAKLVDIVTGPAAQAQQAADDATMVSFSVNEKYLGAVSARDDALDALRLCQEALDRASNAEALARTLVRKHFPTNDTLTIPHKSQSRPEDDGQGTIRWDDNYVYLKTTTGYKRIPLESF